jgi:tRNA nucleotidyltransferase (CCA-adding enzyme)
MSPDSPFQAAALLARLPGPVAAALARAAALAAEQRAGLWLVGGVVRDLLLGAPPGRDVDLAVEGDAPALAAALAAEGGRVLAAHAPFGTATVELPAPGAAPLIVDLARARAERYPRPAALPEVEPAPIEADLIRRDFSVNALALELRAAGGGLEPGRLLDLYGGREDLAARTLRLLHGASLRDDPTRVLRGLRLAARLGLRPEPATEAQIGAALAAGYLGMLSAERVLGELCLALEEPRPDHVLRLADAWGVTPQVLPGLGWSDELGARGAAIAVGGGPPAGPLVWAGALLYGLEPAALAAIAARYPLPAEAAALLRQLPALREAAARLRPGLPNSAVDRTLRPFTPAAVAVLHYAEPSAAEAASRYLTTLRAAKAPLDGNDLRRLGVAPGPQLGRLLDELRAAALDGAVGDRAEAEAWVRGRLGA